MEYPLAVAWYAAVDYVRMTWRPGADRQHLRDDLGRMALEIGVERGWRGEVVRSQKILGYEGVQAGSCFVGEGYQGLMLQASGIAAHSVIERDLQPENVSRLDLQCTVSFETYHPHIATKAQADTLIWRDMHKGRRYKVRHIDGSGDGDTLYIGARGKRGVMIRIYDKYKESKSEEYTNAWRWEAELTDDYALSCYRHIRHEGSTEQVILMLLRGYLRSRGVDTPTIVGASLVERESIPVPASTNERRLAWLRAQVRPAIDKLVAAGVDSRDIAAILGLSGDDDTLAYTLSE